MDLDEKLSNSQAGNHLDIPGFVFSFLMPGILNDHPLCLKKSVRRIIMHGTVWWMETLSLTVADLETKNFIKETE